MEDEDTLAVKLKEILMAYLANPSLIPELAAHQLTSSIGAPQDDGSFCWILWAEVCFAVECCVNESTAERNEQIARLVALVAAVKVQPAPPAPSADAAKPQPRMGPGMILWKDLPNLGPQMREIWNDNGSKPSWACLNIFAAMLTAHDIADFALYGLWAMRSALEGACSWSPPPSAKYTIPIACLWVEHAGETLRKRTNDCGNAGRGAALWTGRSGFCDERWTFWREQLRKASNNMELSEAVRCQARQAADWM